MPLRAGTVLWGSQVYLFESCIDIPDQCVGFLSQGHAEKHSWANCLGIARRGDAEKHSGGKEI